MPLSLQEVEHIAKLARLELTEDEKNRYREQLSAILDHVAQLQKLDTASIQPTAGVFSTDKPMRVDEPRPGLSTEALLSTAAQKERSQFKIPPVFE
ncbi:MAG TPA: Asp-tRNA(Asn)/Glu-tRNA(Gln) amidotransferase subunit GatC [Anaerolineales bacterium]|jgi:aspartyl-tRNA(Asn)/glutamyl-tRNA(Gln) amidotransferase subunit C